VGAVTTHVVSPIEFDGREIEVTGHAYQHLFRARRMRVGEEMRIVDGEGRARRGVVARVESAHGVVALGSSAPSFEAARSVELVVSPPKPDRVAWLVEKATELGVAAVRFVHTDRTARDERSFGASQILRLRRVALSAVEQCGRAVVPEVGGLEQLPERLAAIEASRIRAVALDLGAPPAPPVAGTAGDTSGLVVLIGPEGGWSDEERTRFDSAGIERRDLGERVLRVETAAVAACALALTSSLL
jgi:16S rRNA (uracil1498-N3)-methyltransferase